jgi:hypothetical protein
MWEIVRLPKSDERTTALHFAVFILRTPSLRPRRASVPFGNSGLAEYLGFLPAALALLPKYCQIWNAYGRFSVAIWTGARTRLPISSTKQLPLHQFFIVFI